MTSAIDRAESRLGGVRVRPLSRAEQHAAGKALRETCPRQAHAAWKAPSDRRDAVELVLEAEKGRMPDLLSLRHGRMVRSAFTFYRGAALTMATDLASTPSTGGASSAAGTPTCATSAGSPPRSARSSSRSTTSTRPSRRRGNGTSSAWPRASSWPAETKA